MNRFTPGCHTSSFRSCLAPNSRTGAVLAVLILLVTQRLSTATDYYVSPSGLDTSAGTQTAPFRTISKAAAVATPGTTVHVGPGTYSSGPFITNASGTSAAPIRFVSESRWKALVRTTDTNMHIAWTNNGSYVDIEGFDVSCNGRIGILNNGSFCRFIGNHVHDIPAADVAGSGGAGILHGNYSAHDNDSIGNVVHHIGPSTATSTVHGIYHSNLRGRIVNNLCYLNSGYGIHLWHAANQVTITSNLVFKNGNGGIIVGAGDSPGGVTADNCMVSNNTCMYNGGIAIYEYGATGTNNKYLNNLIWGNASGMVVKVTPVGTISADPKLVNFQADGSGDYHLTSASPCLDAGTSQGAPAIDYDGIPRPQGNGFDIGPFELAAHIAGGLVAYWKLDEAGGLTALDSSGNGHTGSLVNGPVRTSGKMGGALSFDGVDDFVSIPNSADLNVATQSFTYSLWVRVAQSAGSFDMPWWKGGGSVGSIGYDMELGTGSWSANISDGVSLKSATFGSETLNQWVLLTAVVDRATSQLRTYKNGVFVASTSLAGFGSVSNSNDACLGGPSGYRFKGLLDEVRIYNYALSSAEVAALASGIRPPAGDFNADRKADLLLRHPSSGEVFLWLMK